MSDETDARESLYYSTTGKKLCYIINNEKFNRNLNLSNRDGTNVDFKNLVRTFELLNFQVEYHKDSKSLDMIKNLKNISCRPNLKDYSMFVCIIMSHGDEGFVFGADDQVSIETLLKIFKGDICPALRGKPKIFFIQACRGDKFDTGVAYHDAVVSNNIEKIPIEADFVIGYSTVAGYFSWRNAGKGSWYIQALCDVLQRNGKRYDLLHLLVQVNNAVALEFRSNTGVADSHNMLQLPSFICMSRKLIRFSEELI